MRLINSDGQVCDAKVVAQPGGNANRNSITLVDGRLSVIAICTVICGASAVAAFAAWQRANDAYTESRMVQYYLQDPTYRTPDELAAWGKFRREQEKH